MDKKNCRGCGKEIAGGGEVYCPDCKSDIRRKSRKRLWYSGVATVTFLLAGAAFLCAENNTWEFSWNALIGRPAAVVNGGPIASCCGPGGSGGAGGCGMKQGSSTLDPELKSKAGAAAIEAYREIHPTEKGLGVKVTDYGCHIQVDIEKEGKIVASYSYSDGKVFEI